MTATARHAGSAFRRLRPTAQLRVRRWQSTNAARSSSSSVDPTEISHFNSLASTWWDTAGPSRLLHQMNPLRHDFIRACHASQRDDPLSPTRKLRYLDIGCGGGIFAESAARLPSTESVTAIDPSPAVLAVARAHARRDPELHPVLRPGRLTYLESSVEALLAQAQADAEAEAAPRADAGPNSAGAAELPPSARHQYDVVTVFEVVEHVDAPAAFLDRCGALVRPGGWLVLSTIARTWASWLTTKVVAEDVLRIVPPGTHDWHRYINEDELRGHFAGRTGWGGTNPRCMGVVYVPGLGWKEVPGSEKLGNYFFGVRKDIS